MDASRLRLTVQQRRILDAFRCRADQGLPPPTYRDLCREFGWKSTGTARDHIQALVRKGVLCAADRRSRGAHLRARRPPGRTLPVVGQVAAGRPVVCEENTEREILVADEFAPSAKAFVLRVSGDSMEEAGILPGDFVVVRHTRTPKYGDIVAVTLEGETTLKRLQQRRGKNWLIAANPRYEAIEIRSDAIVHGVVTAVMRRLEDGATHSMVWQQAAVRS